MTTSSLANWNGLAIQDPPPQTQTRVTTNDSSDHYMKSLFTPTPSPAPPAAKMKVFMSHVAVPPLPQGRKKSDYRRFTKDRDSSSRPSVQVHISLGDALQGAISHNANIGVMNTISRKIKQPSSTNGAIAGPSSSVSSRGSGAQAFKRKYALADDAYADYDDWHYLHHGKRTKSCQDHARQKKNAVSDGPRQICTISDSEDDDYKPTHQTKRAIKAQAEWLGFGVERIVSADRNSSERAPRSHTTKDEAVRIEITPLPRDDIEMVAFHLRFLRQAVEEQDHVWSWVPFDGVCEPSEPCWRRWTSCVCESLAGTPEEDISLGGFLGFSDEEDVDVKSEEAAVSVYEQLADPLSFAARLPEKGSPTDAKEDQGTFPSNPLPSGGFDDENHRPSAKALGKQRAISPITDGAGPRPSRHSPPSSLSRIHMNTTSPVTPNKVTQSHTSTEITLSVNTPGPISQPMNSPFLAQATHSHLDLPPPGHLSTSTDYLSFTLYGSPLKADSIAPIGDRPFISGSPLVQESASSHLSGYYPSADLNGGFEDLWTGDPTPLDATPFGDGTIDPSLLSGSVPTEEEVLHPFPGSPSLSPLPSLEPSPEPSHALTPGSFVPSTESSPEPSVPRKSSSSQPKHARESSPSTPLRTLRPHIRTPRLLNDMVSSADLHLTSSSEYESDAETLLSRRPGRPKKKQSMPLANQEAKKSQGGAKPVQPTRGGNWPKILEEGYCHQCRSKSKILKIFCSCARKFCVRCLSTRYDEVLYDPDAVSSFVCPVCKNMCTCDKCMPLRGEVYVPLRGGKVPDSVPVQRSSVREKTGAAEARKPGRKRLGGKTNLPPPVAVPGPTYSGPVAYFGAMYDLTGAKIGSAFLGTSGPKEVVVVQPLQKGSVQLEESTQKEGRKGKKKPKKRVYIGEIEPSWGFGDDVLVGDLDPVSWKDRNNGPHERIYVGNKAMLYKPFVTDLASREGPWQNPHCEEAVEEDDDDGCSSSLTSLEDEGDVTGAGESRQWPSRNKSDDSGIAVGQQDFGVFMEKGPGRGFSADSLREVDVARAMTMGLMACGVSVQVLF